MSQSAVQRLTHTRELMSAILVTARNVFTHTPVSIDRDTGPLTRIAGLTLFQRSLLTLQRCGISQVFVLAGEEVDMLKSALSDGPPVNMGIRWIPVREFPPEDPRTWETLAADTNGACVVVGPQSAFSRGLIETLRGFVQGEELIVVVQREPGGISDGSPQDRSVLRKRDRLAHLAESVLSMPSKPVPGGLWVSEVMLVPAGGFIKGSPLAELLLTRGAEDQAGETPMARLIEAAAAERRVRVVEATGVLDWSREVHDAGDAQAVERDLYRSLKSNFDGVVDRYFNRKLSPYFTKLFLALKLSPNAITVLATLIGLASAACFAAGSYAAGLIGALLLQLSAVIDCCDGEVARLTFTESPFGAKLDMWLDNVAHMAIFAAIAYGAYHHATGLDPHVFVWGGCAVVLANIVSFWGVTKLAARQQHGARSAWADFLLKNVATRDFFMVILVFAAVGQLPSFLLLAAAGSVIFGLLTLGLVIFSRAPRA